MPEAQAPVAHQVTEVSLFRALKLLGAYGDEDSQGIAEILFDATENADELILALTLMTQYLLKGLAEATGTDISTIRETLLRAVLEDEIDEADLAKVGHFS